MLNYTRTNYIYIGILTVLQDPPSNPDGSKCSGCKSRKRKFKSMEESRTVTFNAHKISIKTYETIWHTLNVFAQIAHVDWVGDGVVGTPRMQTRIPEVELYFINHCTNLVRSELVLQTQFASIGDMEASKRRDSGFQYMRHLSIALKEITTALSTMSTRFENRENRKNITASRKFHFMARRRAHGLCVSRAQGRRSPLRNVTNVNHPDLINIMEASTQAISWDDYVKNNLNKLGSNVG
ncbi:hypothetical protein F5Y12DRAFT_383463 [Xylaria sp. FL1777]|nr:hypothetical protein F5Y12DRAFT_383463 [Xylaria sp. FL1777]